MTDEFTGRRKSAHSFSNGNCVEVGSGPAVIGVRDSADHDGPVLTFSAGDWKTFTAEIRAGDR